MGRTFPNATTGLAAALRASRSHQLLGMAAPLWRRSLCHWPDRPHRSRNLHGHRRDARGFFGVAPGVAPEITIPLTSNSRPSSLQSATSSWVHLIGRLRDGASLAEANAALEILAGCAREAPQDRDARTGASSSSGQTSIESARAGFSRVRNRFAKPLWFLFGLVGLLLAVAAASAANLLLARGAARRREISVRLAIGAGRWRLVRQMLTEAMVLTSIAAAGGLLIANWGAGSLLALMTTREQVIDLEAGISSRIVLFTLALAGITSALCSVIPAIRARVWTRRRA